MFEVTRVDNLFGPLKGMCGLRIGVDKVVNRSTQLPERGYAKPFERLTPQDAEHRKNNCHKNVIFMSGIL